MTTQASEGRAAAQQPADSGARASASVLSPRESQCLSLLAHGFDNAGIAESLGIRVPTVAMHLANARAKLNAGTREQAVAIAVSRGIVTLTPPAATQ